MKLFHCQYCGQRLDFENTRCERCGHVVGYMPELVTLSALDPVDGRRWWPLAAPGEVRRFCANAVHDACNWLVPEQPPGAFCVACRLNRTIPNINIPENLRRWQRMEAAKRWLVYGLLRLGLPLLSKGDDPQDGLAFDFLANDTTWLEETEVIITGHAHGVITMNVAEADDEERERQRREMAESYRTLLGHFRHEVGHYYWERLVRDGPWLERFRAVFGDESAPYTVALDQYRSTGPPANWGEQFISAYASAHPLEDWAETWAHYLHLVDTLETAQVLNVRNGTEPGMDRAADAPPAADPYREADFGEMVRAWVPLTYAVNSINRSMGQPDLYPFVLAPAVIEKLGLVHELIRTHAGLDADALLTS